MPTKVLKCRWMWHVRRWTCRNVCERWNIRNIWNAKRDINTKFPFDVIWWCCSSTTLPLCICYASTMLPLRFFYALIMFMLCLDYASIMFIVYFCYDSVMLLLCCCGCFIMPLLCFHWNKFLTQYFSKCFLFYIFLNMNT